MWQIRSGDDRGLVDVATFRENLGRLQTHENDHLRELFDPTLPLICTRAPGRMDVMGGIADYSGSLVLQMPIAEAALCALQVRPSEHSIEVVSRREDGRHDRATCRLEELADERGPSSYDAVRAHFARDGANHWSAYVLGAFVVLMREHGVRFPHGCRIYLDSRVPEGKGVSSSAALEVAAMQAIATAYEVALADRDIALACQTVENRIVGAPCGVMDQMASACGRAGRLLALRCQPAEIEGHLALPAPLAVFGIDSDIRHSVGGADYGSVRCAAFMGHRILCELAGHPVDVTDGRRPVADAEWQGYLANVPLHRWMAWQDRLPPRMRGGDFLERYTGTIDHVTTVDPEIEYPVRAATAHPIQESQRIRCFAELLAAPASAERDRLLGELMYQSHASYSACGLGSDGTDRLVEAVDRPRGPEQGFFGAKITGGGSGGTVAILAAADQEARIHSLAEAYAADTGRDPTVFTGSSPGAGTFGHLVLVAS